MITPPSQCIGIATSGAEKLADYFPTAAEPDFLPTEPPFTPDDQLLVDELRRRGHQVSAIVWGGETSRLAEQFDRLIVRFPWDYMDSDEQCQGFLSWLGMLAATELVVENEPQVMLWLMDKRYLLDFVAVGVPIVPTQFMPVGEWSLVYFGGEYSHGVHKRPASGQIMVHAERGGSLRFADPPAVVRELGDRTAAAVPRAFAHRCGSSCRMPLYLRIDVIETAAGGLLSECERVEPELFFRARPGNAARFARLIENGSISR